MSNRSRLPFHVLAATALLTLSACSIQASGYDEDLRDRVRSLERRVQRLEQPAGATQTAGFLMEERMRIQLDLIEARSQYEDNHPDVRAKVARLAEIERQLAAVKDA